MLYLHQGHGSKDSLSGYYVALRLSIMAVWVPGRVGVLMNHYTNELGSQWKTKLALVTDIMQRGSYLLDRDRDTLLYDEQYCTTAL